MYADDATANSQFGWSVSVFGDTLIVGAYNSDDYGSNTGEFEIHIYIWHDMLYSNIYICV